MRPFQELVVWQKSHQLTLSIYEMTKSFPRAEMYGLTSQLRRAAASIPMNIAEGSARGTGKEFAQSLSIALGSAAEVEYQLLLARDLEYLDAASHPQLESQLAEVKKMLVTLRRRVVEQVTKS
ncbi:MAG: four helix bundle protein [Hyphomicrobiales bacterium]